MSEKVGPHETNSGQMYKRPLMGIGNAMAKNFMGDRRNISLAKNQKTEHVSDGTAFCPFKIYVWQSASGVAYVNQDCGDRVGDGRAGSTQDLVSAHADARDPQRSFEFRRIHPLNFQKEQLLIGAEIVCRPCKSISRFVLLD